MTYIVAMLVIALVLFGIYAVIDWWLGPDSDLGGPWQPGDRPRWRS